MMITQKREREREREREEGEGEGQTNVHGKKLNASKRPNCRLQSVVAETWLSNGLAQVLAEVGLQRYTVNVLTPITLPVLHHPEENDENNEHRQEDDRTDNDQDCLHSNFVAF